MNSLLFLSAGLIMLASLSAVMLVWFNIGHWLRKNTGYLTSFAAGVFLVVVGQLIRHTIKNSETLTVALAMIALGALLVYVLFSYVPFFHHHHDECVDCEHEHDRPQANRVLFADGLHNIGDGILLVASFSVSQAAGLAAAFGVLIHEIVQEISEFFVLKSAGFSTKRALLYNFLASSTILLGIALTVFLTDMNEQIRATLLSLTAGSFLVVVANDLIPHSIESAKGRHDIGKHIGFFAVGAMLMLVAFFAISH